MPTPDGPESKKGFREDLYHVPDRGSEADWRENPTPPSHNSQYFRPSVCPGERSTCESSPTSALRLFLNQPNGKLEPVQITQLPGPTRVVVGSSADDVLRESRDAQGRDRQSQRTTRG